jgi:glutamate synthase domain-containing protein 1
MAISKLFSALPERDGLYDPSFEHDACGVAMVATLNKNATHEIVEQGLEALRNLDHRGASGAEVNSGDGAGILIGIPDQFFRSVLSFKLPELGSYAAGIAFIPREFKEWHALRLWRKKRGWYFLVGAKFRLTQQALVTLQSQSCRTFNRSS